MLDRAGQLGEQPFPVDPDRGPQLGDVHPAGGDRAGLVEHDRVDRPRRLQRLVALDEHAQLRAAAGRGQQRGRGGQAERARAGDDQHGQSRC